MPPKYTKKQLWFIAFNPPAWVYILVRYVLWPVGRASAIGVFTTMLHLVSTVGAAVAWDILNKIRPRYVAFWKLEARIAAHKDTKVVAGIVLGLLGAAFVSALIVASSEITWMLIAQGAATLIALGLGLLLVVGTAAVALGN